MTKEVLLMIKQTVNEVKKRKEFDGEVYFDERTYKVYIDIWNDILQQYNKYPNMNNYITHPSRHFEKYFALQDEMECSQSFKLLVKELFEDGFKMLTENGALFPDYFYIPKQVIEKIGKKNIEITSNNKKIKR